MEKNGWEKFSEKAQMEKKIRQQCSNMHKARHTSRIFSVFKGVYSAKNACNIIPDYLPFFG